MPQNLAWRGLKILPGGASSYVFAGDDGYCASNTAVPPRSSRLTPAFQPLDFGADWSERSIFVLVFAEVIGIGTVGSVHWFQQ